MEQFKEGKDTLIGMFLEGGKIFYKYRSYLHGTVLVSDFWQSVTSLNYIWLKCGLHFFSYNMNLFVYEFNLISPRVLQEPLLGSLAVL